MQIEKQIKNRVEWVDIAKGIGIILVVFGHAILGDNILKSNYPDTHYFLVKFLWAFHMPLFFFLSGMFLSNWVKKDFKDALTTKFKSIIIPYIIWSIILGTVYQLISLNPTISAGSNNVITLREFLLFPFYPMLSLWFLYTLFWTQMSYYVFKKKLKLNFGYIFFLAIIVYFFNPLKVIWFCDYLFAKNFIFLILGAYIAEKNLVFPEIKKHKLFIFSFILLFLILNSQIAFSKEYVSFFRNSGLLIIPALMGIFSVILISQMIQNFSFSKILTYIGQMSLYIYLIHVFITPAIRIIMQNILNIENVFLTVFVGTVGGVFLSILSYKILSKLNIDKYLFGR